MPPRMRLPKTRILLWVAFLAIVVGAVLGCTAIAFGLPETRKRPELIDSGWLGPRDEMDRASHGFGKCSECRESIYVEKALTDGPCTRGQTGLSPTR